MKKYKRSKVNEARTNLKKQEIELTLKVNGEDKPLSFLSEETLLNLREGEEEKPLATCDRLHAMGVK